MPESKGFHHTFAQRRNFHQHHLSISSSCLSAHRERSSWAVRGSYGRLRHSGSTSSLLQPNGLSSMKKTNILVVFKAEWSFFLFFGQHGFLLLPVKPAPDYPMLLEQVLLLHGGRSVLAGQGRPCYGIQTTGYAVSSLYCSFAQKFLGRKKTACRSKRW